jgi:TolB protein
MKKSLHWLTLLLVLLLPTTASAQQQGLEIDIVGGSASAMPIAVVPMLSLIHI